MSLRGYVRDAGGGVVTVVVERDTDSYPPTGILVDVEWPAWTNWWQCINCRMILDRDGPPPPDREGPYTCQHCGKVWS